MAYMKRAALALVAALSLLVCAHEVSAQANASLEQKLLGKAWVGAVDTRRAKCTTCPPKAGMEIVFKKTSAGLVADIYYQSGGEAYDRANRGKRGAPHDGDIKIVSRPNGTFYGDNRYHWEFVLSQDGTLVCNRTFKADNDPNKPFNFRPAS